LSQCNACLDADASGFAAMANASFYTHQPLPTYAPEKAADVSKYLAADGSVLPKRYVTYYVGDYDAAAWMYQMLPRLWGDSARDSVPMTWAFNPNLSLRFPAGFDYTHRTRSANDWFMAGDSGAGYVNPSQLAEPRESGMPSGEKLWEAHNSKFGLSITGFVIDGSTPPMPDSMLDSYTRFSPNGVICHRTENRTATA
jgi:hypothetical protein